MIGSVIATLALGLMVAIPAAADTNQSRSRHVTRVQPPRVQAFKLKLRGYGALQITQAISNVPSRTVRKRVSVGHKRKHRTKLVTEVIPSKQDWVVVSHGTAAELLSVTSSHKTKLVATGLLPTAAVPGGQSNPIPGYGSVEADGYVWLLDYSVSPAPLYVISRSGTVHLAASLTGDFTDLTAGPDNTLEIADNSGNIDRCAISKEAVAKCTAAAVPKTFASGQVDAIGTAGGRVWFTDDNGELGSFSPYRDTFKGPFGDFDISGAAAGEASTDPGTIVNAPGGRMYLAGGEDSDPLFENNLIRLVNGRTGRLIRSYGARLTNVVGVTYGSDGNVWFLDETNVTTGAGKVGMLDTKTGRIRQYAIPKGYRLPAYGAGIDPGPIGSDTVFFTLQTDAGAHAALGEVTGIQPPF